ncbi:GrdX family protein [Hathewaya histolytica]|uniref:GrdX protein n=1 Tax=Hathewaya histolytica TaxID=1498 RepID=A0A4U9RW72_HATHI|nr:GrdX family protein [Hathewaya histolytica]VTQ96088.1 GrdX protein [Hathewaya histolytica]
MKYLIVTNNPIVKEKNSNVYFVEGSMEELLIKVRDLVHKDFELVTHPLGASLRMIFSPYRSVILKKNQGSSNYFHIELIENSIEKYRNHMEVRNEDKKNAKDYALIDSTLLESAFSEINDNVFF